MLQVTNDVGRCFQVRLIRRGERYGLNGCLLHAGDDCLVEFTDVTAPGGPGPAPEKGFVARYPERIFLDREDDTDLWLFGQDVAWRLSAQQVREVRRWVREMKGW